MFIHSKNTTFKIDDSGGTLRDITEYTENVGLNLTADTAETTPFAVDSKGYVPGMKDGQISTDVLWDPTVDGYLFGILAKTGSFEYSPDGGTTVYTGECICTGYNPASSTNSAVKGSASFQITGDVSRA